MTEQINRFV